VREQMETLTGLEGGQGFRYVLARTDFRLVWFAQLAGQSADKFVMFSLIILAYGLHASSFQVAVTLLAYTLPALFLPAFAGVYADRHNRKTTMVWTNLGRAAASSSAPPKRPRSRPCCPAAPCSRPTRWCSSRWC